MKNALKRLYQILLQRFDNVDDLLSGMNKYQTKLVQLSERARAAAVKQEAEAEELRRKAAERSAEAERATTVANRFRDLLK